MNDDQTNNANDPDANDGDQDNDNNTDSQPDEENTQDSGDSNDSSDSDDSSNDDDGSSDDDNSSSDDSSDDSDDSSDDDQDGDDNQNQDDGGDDNSDGDSSDDSDDESDDDNNGDGQSSDDTDDDSDDNTNSGDSDDGGNNDDDQNDGTAQGDPNAGDPPDDPDGDPQGQDPSQNGDDPNGDPQKDPNAATSNSDPGGGDPGLEPVQVARTSPDLDHFNTLSLRLIRIRLFDPFCKPLPNTPYRLRAGGQTWEDTADGDAWIEVHTQSVPDACVLDWGQDGAPGAYSYSTTLFLDLEDPDDDEGRKRRLHNLGYSDGNVEENMTSFQSDYRLNALDQVPSLLRDWHNDPDTVQPKPADDGASAGPDNPNGSEPAPDVPII